ncbi:MAG: serine hydrolase [Candidatus Magasanikbacteria bacterium]|nr:serine hydrolase [Candidatus Magasanikbacteria bacterium]
MIFFRSTTTTTTDAPSINNTVTANLGKHFIINFKPLKTELEKIQKSYPQKTYIYFSYLNSGSWVGLNERDEFAAASTLKVPLAMALMKAVEEKKLKLSDSYSLEELDLNQYFGDLYKAGADKEFTVEELLKIMLEQSDNTAFNAMFTIFRRIGIDNPLGEVYGFLGWELAPSIPEIGETPDYSKITLKTLANLFITLYDAKYVSVEYSNKLLAYLANTPFNDKIDAGVPEDVTVAHKIGTATLSETFSDCGIVYAPNRNYLLCLGSNGGDEKRAAKFMVEVSTAVYKYVINN